MISIILNRYDPTQWQTHMTMACLAAIRKFTDPPYEIIVVDNEPVHRIRDEYKVLEPYTLIENKQNQTVYHSYNQGAEVAKGEFLIFVQSDVFVHERTINKLAKYLFKYDAAFPQQVPITREDVKQIYQVEDGEDTHIGGRDAGMIAITKKAFERCGGWDGRFKNLLGERAFFQRWDDYGVTWTDRTNAFITHIAAGHNLQKKQDLYNKQMAFDAELGRKEYGWA